MLITSLYLDNIYTFCDTSFDLTYKRPLSFNLVPNEFLKNRPKFYIKKVCVISGVNASGKTSLGRVLFLLQQGLSEPVMFFDLLKECWYDKSKSAKIGLEFVTHLKEPTLHKVMIEIGKIKSIAYQSTYIGVNDSVKMARDKLNKKSVQTFYQETLFELEIILKSHIFMSWYYLFSENEIKQQAINANKMDLNILKAILQTFDNSIEDVLLSQDDKGVNGFNIYFKNGDTVLVDKEGHTTNAHRLSRGTYDALSIANMVSWIVSNILEFGGSVYFLDEKMAFAHSELEQAILNLIIEKLPINAQFFYTTHNYDILDMNLPIHSYLFLKKKDGLSQFVKPEHFFKKNDRTLLGYVKNNVFKTLPNTTLIDNLL